MPAEQGEGSRRPHGKKQYLWDEVIATISDGAEAPEYFAWPRG